MDYVSKKILTQMVREARGGLKATIGNILTTRLSFYRHSFLFFSVSFNQSQSMVRRMPTHIGHCRPKPG